ncbi:hypothetical protein OG792_08215 [Micromonospora sp. NBC_01699]|uniref:hypothetical protein n=1 Tax=Micromonospora sp. NBC_01699 TaxID=2975984 RepID=UPI002E3810AA|nr:hypothetical protein [Micromonospora sp. NBC_01699]
MRLNKRLLAATSVVVAVLVGAVAPAQAAGSTSEKSGQYCVVVLGKASNPATISPELYRHCSPHSFDTRAHLQDIEVQNELAGILAATNAVTGGEVATSAVASTHLFRAWSAAGYEGEYWDYYGSEPCDEYGYYWNPSGWWSTHLSSIERGYQSNCDRVRLHTIDGSAWAEFNVSLSNLTSTYNDNVGELQIWNG